MRFEHQHLLWLSLPTVLGLAAFFWWAWRKKQRLIGQFVRSRLLANLTVGVSARRQKHRMALLVAAVAMLVVALARPQWGFDWEEARQRGLDVVVAIDTSRSMLAADIPPNRLARAKLAALDLKRLARTDRLGLVAFAGSAFLQCPLSFDDEAFRQSVNALDTSIIPLGGSAIAEAIETARAAFKERNDNYKILVLFTDGEDNDGRAVEAAERAARDGMRIFTIGVGTANGELLRITDAKGRTDFVRDEQGNVIKSRLNEALLRDIARAANGHYMLLSGANTLEMLYENALAPLPKSEFTARRVKRYHERYQWLLGGAIVLLLLEMFLPERKRARRAAAISNAPVATTAAVLVLWLAPAMTFASSTTALKKYQAGNYRSALREYERLLKERPDEPRLEYNAGAAAFQLQDYEKARKHFHAALAAQDLALQQRSFYNLGNTEYRLGEEQANPTQKQARWQEAIKSYESALELNPKDADAEYNRELVKKKLEELKQQQQQQQQDQDKEKQEKQDQQNKEEPSSEEQKQEQNKDQKENQQKPDDKQQQQQQQQQQADQKDQEKKEDQQRQPQSSPESDKKDDAKSQQPRPQQEQNKENQGEPQQSGAAQQMIQMTPEQAQRLLESIKSEEKVMIFAPTARTNRSNRTLKDW